MENKKQLPMSEKMSIGDWLISLWDKSKSHFLVGVVCLVVPVLYYTIIRNTNRELRAKDARVALVEKRLDEKDSIIANQHRYYQSVLDRKDSLYNEVYKKIIDQQIIIKDKLKQL